MGKNHPWEEGSIWNQQKPGTEDGVNVCVVTGEKFLLLSKHFFKCAAS